VSLDEQASLSDIVTAAALMGNDSPASIDDLAPAVASGLVEHDHAHINFSHPLIPAAIYQTESAARRRRAHAALATVLVDDPNRQAWHRAASVTAPDEAIANELEAAAFTSKARWRPSMRVAALERAADLTPDTALRHQRLLRATELALDVGETERADRMLSEISPEGSGPLDQARIRLVRDRVEPGFVADPRAVDWLVDAAIQASSAGETDLALRLLQAAARRSWWADLGPDVRGRIVAATRDVVAPEGEPIVLSILAITDPEGSGETLRRVGSQTAPTSCDAETAYALGTALHMVGAFDCSAVWLEEALGRLRRQGSMWVLPEALTQRAWNAIYTNNWTLATSAAEEATQMARDLRQPLWEAAAQATLALISAIHGDERITESLLAEAESIAVPIGASAVLADAQLARAIIALGGGRYEEAFEHLQRTFDPHDPAHHFVRSAWRIGELAEAAVRAGRIVEAREQVAECESKTCRSLSPRLRVGLLYARALLADDDNAEACFQAALREDLTSWPLYRARLLLQYGMWLRRRRKIAQARMPLRAARDSLVALGATAWVERARQELRASRETQHNGRGAWMQLTEQELQIAQMAAQGLSNRQIGQHLYISPRTVGSHLYRIFPKLGIASRTQLAIVLESSSSTATAC
jgi:DNA-binding CsgD family transcriptional regulator